MKSEPMMAITTRRVGCSVSKMILVAGHPVGFLYREKPRDDRDSGWYFMAGPESAEYMADPANHAVYDLDSISGDDPEIIPLLDAPIGSVFTCDRASGRFVEMGFAPPAD